jgi:hypothetical protein
MSKFNFFDRVIISSADFDIKLSWSFNSAGFLLLVESTNSSDDVIEYSFDGISVHGDLIPGTVSQGLSFDNRHESSVWFRRANFGSGVTVRVEAWA